MAKAKHPAASVESSPARSKRSRWAVIALAALAIVAAGFRIWQHVRNPDVALLIDRGDARWICTPGTFDLVARTTSETQASFRNVFSLHAAPPSAKLVVRAYRLSWVMVNGQQALPPSDVLADWKTPREVDISPLLQPGENEIVINVLNRDGPPAVMAHCDAINLATDERWTVLIDNHWMPAALASARRQPDIARQFPPAERAFISVAPLLLPVFVIAALWTMARDTRLRIPLLSKWQPSPGAIRWALMVAWIVLAINNIWRLPFYIGFGVQGHIEYIMLMVDHGRLPLANDGWQTFQSPLYYLLCWPIVEMTFGAVDLENIIKLLRVIGLLCGLAQIELCYRAARLAFPARSDAQIVGTVVGGLLPMNLYMSQYMGNEPLAAVFMSAAIVLALAFAYGPQRWRSPWAMAMLGAAIGLALLSKVTAVLLVPILIGWIAWFTLRGNDEPAKAGGSDSASRRGATSRERGRATTSAFAHSAKIGTAIKRISIIIVVALLISGWYYARNWIELGRPFVGGWEARQVTWWQEPGFRTPAELSRFGTSLRWPVFASTAGLWDSIYCTMWTDGSLSSLVAYEQRPPWNYGFMLSGALLGIVPSIVTILGAVMTIVLRNGGRREARALALIGVCVIIAAIADLYMQVPIYSTAKASYSLGFLTCYAILAGAGTWWLNRNTITRAVLAGLIAMWAVGAYIAYFVVK